MKPSLDGVRLVVLLTDGISALPFPDLVTEIVAGGADMLQLREKSLPDSVFLERARLVRSLAGDALFIVNDRADIARLAGADGVHVGPDDIPVPRAREMLPPGAIVGASAYTMEVFAAAAASGADYIGVGASFPTGTKDAPVTGLSFITSVARDSHVPVIAIGGITAEHIPEVMAAGAAGVAVLSAVAGAPDMEGTARKLADLVRGGRRRP
mgnify:CR=1 FL=1